MAGSRRLNQLAEAVSARLDLPDGLLVVALSGGADSAALLYLCTDLGTKTRALHVNHGLAHSDMMESAAVDIAQRLGIDLDVVAVRVEEGPSPEGQARRARYAAFVDRIGEGERLLTAHTRDDNVETVVFNLIRGTGPRGLGGIPHYRPHNVFRPMLTIARSETREIAALAGLPFVDDPMNDDPGLTRNVIRSRVIPMLVELNPRLSESIARMATTVASDSAYLDNEAAQVRILHGDDSVGVAVGDLLAVAKPLGDRLLKTMLTHTVGSEGVSAERVERLWSVARAERAAVELAAEVRVVRRGPLLVIEKQPDWLDIQPVTLSPGRHHCGRVEFDVLSHDGPCMVAPLSAWAAIFPANAELAVGSDGVVTADGEPAWTPGGRRLAVAWYEPGSVGYLSIFAKEVTGWTSSP
jgi:tRNA(Ile)-lysidine synthetase-like protein